MIKRVMFGDIGVRPLDVEDTTDHEIRLGRNVYKFNSSVFATGDFSTIHLGTDANGKRCLLKIAKRPETNTDLEREARVLEFFKTTAKLKEVSYYMPRVLDLLRVDGRVVMVERYDADLISVTQIGQAYPEGLNPQDAAWVARRVMALVSAADMGGLVHGAIVPDHVLVNKVSHNPMHIGWAHAVDPSVQRIEGIITRWREFYPPEVFEKKRPDQRSDIFMAARTIEYLLTGPDRTQYGLSSNVPITLKNFLDKCTEEDPKKRFQSGGEALDELTKLIRKLWGKEYRELEV